MLWPSLGRLLMMLGGVLFLLGLIVVLAGRLGLGSLPGDFTWRRGNATLFAPVASSLLLSIVATIVLNLILRFLR